MKTILLVDDSTSIRNILKGTLAREYVVHEAVDGQEALKRLESGTPVDLVLLDVNMPVLDGLSTLKAIRANPRWLQLPVLMLTTETKAERREEARSLGASGWVLKPCEPEHLLATLRVLL